MAVAVVLLLLVIAVFLVGLTLAMPGLWDGLFGDANQ